MQTDTNDCLVFQNSLSSTHCTASQVGDENNVYLFPPNGYRGKFFSQDLIGTTFQTESIDLDADSCVETVKQEKDIRNSVMRWFEEKGIIAGNPQQIWAKVNRELHKRTFEVIQNKSVCCLENRNSSLLQRRLNRSMNLTM